MSENKQIKRAQALYGVLSVDPETGREALVSVHEDGSNYPLVFSEERGIERARFVAQTIANQDDVEIRIAKFSVREDLEIITKKT